MSNVENRANDVRNGHDNAQEFRPSRRNLLVVDVLPNGKEWKALNDGGAELSVFALRASHKKVPSLFHQRPTTISVANGECLVTYGQIFGALKIEMQTRRAALHVMDKVACGERGIISGSDLFALFGGSIDYHTKKVTVVPSTPYDAQVKKDMVLLPRSFS